MGFAPAPVSVPQPPRTGLRRRARHPFFNPWRSVILSRDDQLRRAWRVGPVGGAPVDGRRPEGLTACSPLLIPVHTPFVADAPPTGFVRRRKAGEHP